jgi:protoporphyrinogen oxidase
VSYFWRQVFPFKNPNNFEQWVINRFGKRLYEIFFKTYTEKVWGMDCKEISADWASQRIKELSLGKAIGNAFSILGGKKESPVITTLINKFRYPRKGPGMLWDAAALKIKNQGGEVIMGARVLGYIYLPHSNKWKVTYQKEEVRYSVLCDHVISSAPLSEISKTLSPSSKSIASALSLRYRDFIVVALILKEKEQFKENWIYVHSPDVKVGRIQNFKSWSADMVPDPQYTCYGLEYFCFEKDNLWNKSDIELIELAKNEIEILGLAKSSDIFDGCVIRQPKAYPVYDSGYAEKVSIIRKDIESNYPGLHLVGRNGMHKYNNQDHAMMTSILTVKNILAEQKLYDPWLVNQDAEYHEEASGLRNTPQRIAA